MPQPRSPGQLPASDDYEKFSEMFLVACSSIRLSAEHVRLFFMSSSRL